MPQPRCPFNPESMQNFTKPMLTSKELLPVKTNASHILTKDQILDLKNGLGGISMDVKWMAHLVAAEQSDPFADPDERFVLRLYRSWTGFLIFEGYYRPLRGVPGAFILDIL